MIRDQLRTTSDRRRSLREWISHNKKLSVVIIGLVIVGLIVIRASYFPDKNPDGSLDRTELIKSLFDDLITTIVVMSSVTVALTFLRPPNIFDPEEAFIQPFDIDRTLRLAAAETREWSYLGHTAHYVRSQIFPIIDRESKSSGDIRRVRIIVLSPEDVELCEAYAKYRNKARSAVSSSQEWSSTLVRDTIFSTVLCAIDLSQRNPLVEVQVAFQKQISCFRVDLSSSIALVTQEDPQLPAIQFVAGSHFYNSYVREINLIWKQSKRLDIGKVEDVLKMDEAHTIRCVLLQAGVDLPSMTDGELLEIGQQALKKVSPYAFAHT